MLTCKQAAKAIGQDDLRTASWTIRLGLRLHLLMCRHCRRYAAQISAIGEAARNVFREQGDDAQALARIKERVLKYGKASADGQQRSRQQRGSARQ